MSFDIEAIPTTDDRTLPWELPGSTDVSDCKTIEEVLEKSGLNWDVQQSPVYQKLPGDRKYRQVPNRVFNERETDLEVFGIVTPKYRVSQNRDSLAFLQALVEDDKAIPDRAGELEGGKLVYVTMRLPDKLDIPHDGELEPYLFLTNAHDGYRTLTASAQVVRYRCTNAIGSSLKNAISYWKVKHTANIASRVAIAKETIGIAGRYFKAFEGAASLLVMTEVNDDQAETLLREIFPVAETATEAQIERSMFFGAFELWKTSETLDDEVRHSAWGVLNAVTEFVDHASKYRSTIMTTEESRAESILFGAGSWKKQKAMDVLTAFAQAS